MPPGLGRFDLGDKMDAILITGFGQMDLVASPVGSLSTAKAGFKVSGGQDACCGRGYFLIGFETDLIILFSFRVSLATFIVPGQDPT